MVEQLFWLDVLMENKWTLSRTWLVIQNLCVSFARQDNFTSFRKISLLLVESGFIYINDYVFKDNNIERHTEFVFYCWVVYFFKECIIGNPEWDNENVPLLYRSLNLLEGPEHIIEQKPIYYVGLNTTIHSYSEQPGKPGTSGRAQGIGHPW